MFIIYNLIVKISGKITEPDLVTMTYITEPDLVSMTYITEPDLVTMTYITEPDLVTMTYITEPDLVTMTYTCYGVKGLIHFYSNQILFPNNSKSQE